MTYKWVKIQPTNGPELQYLTQKAFAKNGRIPFCLGGTRAENNLLAEAYSRFKYVHLLYSADKLIGLIYGNSFYQGDVECVELSLINPAEIDAETVLNEYRATLPANVEVYINLQ
jgi:hypothetical protein